MTNSKFHINLNSRKLVLCIAGVMRQVERVLMKKHFFLLVQSFQVERNFKDEHPGHLCKPR